MFQKAEAMHVIEPYAERARIGIEKCNRNAGYGVNRPNIRPTAQVPDPHIEDLSL
jgi:hypothetical protein